MRTLHLLRHAKSSWDDAALADDERPLAPRGMRASAALRDHAAAVSLHADLVLVSPARRAQQTWETVSPGFAATAVRTEPAIYEATATRLLRLVHDLPAELRSVLLVGHDPAFHELATLLSGAGDADLLTALRSKYPTGALASLTFDVEWSEIAPRTGRLVSFVRPRDLAR
jgi:phosphohistidine phosphatase